jgi:hypothetical protein
MCHKEKIQHPFTFGVLLDFSNTFSPGLIFFSTVFHNDTDKVSSLPLVPGFLILKGLDFLIRNP